MGGMKPTFTESEVREAVAASLSYTEVLRRIGLRPAGGNWKTIRRYVEEVWNIPTDHFDPGAARVAALRRTHRPRPLDEILVEHSTFHRGWLKKRLYDAGLKQPICELCGQGELWRGSRISLILDHINGCATDNRLENLRIVCPNCAATFDTHCGRLSKRRRTERPCLRCGTLFYPDYEERRYCSHECFADDLRGQAQPGRRLVERPPYEELKAELAATSYLAVGRKYGVSDNAIRKWVRQYEREAELARRVLGAGEAGGEEAA